MLPKGAPEKHTERFTHRKSPNSALCFASPAWLKGQDEMAHQYLELRCERVEESVVVAEKHARIGTIHGLVSSARGQ